MFEMTRELCSPVLKKYRAILVVVQYDSCKFRSRADSEVDIERKPREHRR